jgi:uncharacterized membrane protein
VGAGVMHFVATRAYERIMPGYLPEHHALVLVSGVAEIVGGVGVMLPERYFGVRRAAAWGIVALLVAVWPANVWMAQHPELMPGVPVWGLWVRVGFQVVLIGWAWHYTRNREATV